MHCITRLPGVGRRIGLAVLLFSGAAMAASEHEEVAIDFNNRVTLAELLDTTLKRHPGAGVLKASQSTAEAEQKLGRFWFPEAPELGGFHMSDKPFDDIGAFENEVAVSVPLWLPGEKKAQSRLGEAASLAQQARTADFRWRVSALLRKSLWNLVLTKRQWELSMEQEQRLTDLLEQVTLFTEAGELSRADQLATLQELALWKAEGMTLDAEYQDAAREYQALTGLIEAPADISEQQSAEQEIVESHPALQFAMERYAEATAATEVSRRSNSSRPSLLMFWRDFSGDRNSPDINALGIGLAVPLGKSPMQGPEIARANESLARVEAELIATRRALDLQLHEARHVLHTTGLQLENSSLMIEAASERYRLDKLAFELGEFSVQEWLRRLSQLKEIERSHELLLLQQGAAIAAYNQAVGESL